MAYCEFTIKKVWEDFGLTLVEGDHFFPPIAPSVPADYLTEFLHESVPLAVRTGFEKARSVFGGGSIDLPQSEMD